MKLVLGFDTSGPYCTAALISGDVLIGAHHEEMTRGQAERLMPLLEELLAQAGKTWRDLSAIGVGTGPGNFTGLRISVAAARGLALGLDIPAVGVSGCEARAFLAPGAPCAIPAPRDQVYLCDPGDPAALPRQIAADQAPEGTRAPACPEGLAEAIARIAATRRNTQTQPPAPLYLRPADAAPARDAPPVILDS